jgi:hypothetical protein
MVNVACFQEEPLVEDVTMAPNSDLTMDKHPKQSISIMPILTAPDVDEDFQNELSFIGVHDNIGVGAFLTQSRESLDESYRLLQSQQGSEDALRLNAVSQNLRHLKLLLNLPTSTRF